MENKYVFGVDYCLCMIAHPDYYQNHCGWNPESDEEAGEYKEYRERTIRYFWSTNAPYVPMVGTMPISERARNPKLEYFYAPYIVKEWDKEALKLYKHMRRVVGCTNGCFFGDSVTIKEKCDRCYEEATKQVSK